MNRLVEAIANCIDLFRILAIVVVFLIFAVLVIGVFVNVILHIKEKLIGNGNICKKCGFFRNKNIWMKSCTGGFSNKHGCDVKNSYEGRRMSNVERKSGQKQRR